MGNDVTTFLPSLVNCGPATGEFRSRAISHIRPSLPVRDPLTERSLTTWSAGEYDKIAAGFRREAIRLARLGDKPQRQLAKDLGISDVTLRNWLKQERAERGERPGGLSQDEREELRRLRDENARLRIEREILSKAAVFFAKESDGR